MGRFAGRRPEEIAFLEADADRLLVWRPGDAHHVVAGPRATVGGPPQAPALTFERTADGVEEFFRRFGRVAPQRLPRGRVASGHVRSRRQLKDASRFHAQSSSVERRRFATAPQQLHLGILKRCQPSRRAEVVDNASVLLVRHGPGPVAHLLSLPVGSNAGVRGPNAAQSLSFS